jgi:gluconolactonase
MKSTRATTLLTLLSCPAAIALAGCQRQQPPAGSPAVAPPPAAPATPPAPPAPPPPTFVGGVEKLDPALDELVAPDAKVEVLAKGYKWSEGPVWLDGALLFSDVPNNVVWRWHEGDWKNGMGPKEFMRPSGYSGSEPRGGEPGSNGLAVDAEGRLYLCQHGDRRIARWDPKHKTVETIADKFQGKRFNSPNDLVVRANGDVYFTDPIYGLEGHEKDPKREIPWSGVYRKPGKGDVQLLDKELSYPNGLAFSPDGKTLYVAVSDPKKAIWVAYDVDAKGGVKKRGVFFDATAEVKAGKKGLPDGLKIDDKGNLFATGPGGVFVFTPAGKHLGTIVTGEPTANCAFGDDGSTLYMTANDKLTRIKLKTRGPVGALK